MNMVSGLSSGQLYSIVRELGGREGALELLSGELVVRKPSLKELEKNGLVVYAQVTSDGTTGDEWIRRLKCEVSDEAKVMLRSPGFEPTKGITTKIAIFKDLSDQTLYRIYDKAIYYGFIKPNAEIACLIREKFANQEKMMKLSRLIVMHETINRQLFLCRNYNSVLEEVDLSLRSVDNDGRLWDCCGTGFAFAVS